MVVRLLLGLVICEPAPDVDDDSSAPPLSPPFWFEALTAPLATACDLLWERGVGGGGCCSCWPPPADLPRSNPEELASLAFLRTLGVEGGGRAPSLQ